MVDLPLGVDPRPERPGQNAFIARATSWGWLFLPLLLICFAFLAGGAVGSVVLALLVVRSNGGVVGWVTGAGIIAYLGGMGGAALWFLAWRDRSEVFEEFSRVRPGGITVAIDQDGIYLGGLTAGRCRRIPWNQVAEIVVADREMGGYEGFPTWSPYLVARLHAPPGGPVGQRTGDPLSWGPSRSLADVPGDVFGRVQAAADRFVPHLPVTDLREHSPGR